MVDPDGHVPYEITIRAFASMEYFGGGYHGDNRGYSTNKAATARINQQVTVDAEAGYVYGHASSSPTHHFIAPSIQRTATPKFYISPFIDKSSFNGYKSLSFSSHVAGGNPLAPSPSFITPDIDIFASITIVENREQGVLFLSGRLTGDNFPATEAIITDPSGQKVFLGVGHYVGDPYNSLWGQNAENRITEFGFFIKTDLNGNFLKILYGENEFTLDEWNKRFEAQEPGSPVYRRTQ
jgi:hypothetical protein